MGGIGSEVEGVVSRYFTKAGVRGEYGLLTLDTDNGEFRALVPTALVGRFRMVGQGDTIGVAYEASEKGPRISGLRLVSKGQGSNVVAGEGRTARPGLNDLPNKGMLTRYILDTMNLGLSKEDAVARVIASIEGATEVLEAVQQSKQSEATVTST